MRAFIALDFHIQDIEIFSRFQNLLKGKLSNFSISWVKKDNFHITLKFLKNIDEEQRDFIINFLKKIILPSDFSFEAKDLGVFPGLNNPKVLWININCNKELFKLQKEIDLKLSSIGIPVEKRDFIPHLTLGRIKKSSPYLKKYLLPHIRKEFIKNSYFKSLTFYKSELHPEGAIYTSLYRRFFSR